MTYPYLIAHKVRGEPAFDVATQMPCPECSADGSEPTCSECDGLGYWWIISTSGHRAYPIMNWPLNDLYDGDCSVLHEAGPLIEHPQWPTTQDHYTTRATPTITLAEALGLTARKVPTTPIKRRF